MRKVHIQTHSGRKMHDKWLKKDDRPCSWTQRNMRIYHNHIAVTSATPFPEIPHRNTPQISAFFSLSTGSCNMNPLKLKTAFTSSCEACLYKPNHHFPDICIPFTISITSIRLSSTSHSTCPLCFLIIHLQFYTNGSLMPSKANASSLSSPSMSMASKKPSSVARSCDDTRSNSGSGYWEITHGKWTEQPLEEIISSHWCHSIYDLHKLGFRNLELEYWHIMVFQLFGRTDAYTWEKLDPISTEISAGAETCMARFFPSWWR